MAQRLTGGRAWRAAGTALAVGAGALGASACSNGDALTLARQACVHVARSIAIYRAGTASADPQEQQAATGTALTELRKALPLASTAAGEAPQWQALMTTLSESDRVPESALVPALQQQCADAQSGGRPSSPPTAPTQPVTVPTHPEPVGR